MADGARARMAFALGILGAALPAAGLALVLIFRPQELRVQPDVVYGGAWLLFAAGLAPAIAIGVFGIYGVARRRLGWTFSAAVALLVPAAWLAAAPTGSIAWVRVAAWFPALLFLGAAALLRANQRR